MPVATDKTDVKFKNLDKVYWPEEGFTKGDLLNYYLALLPDLWPHLADRPVTMKRYPDGIKGKFFYQKNYPAYAPQWVSRVTVPTEEGPKDMVSVERQETILWLVNLGCIECHTWLSRVAALNKPDIFIFDLDPASPAGFAETLPVAAAIRNILRDYGLESYPKTSGSDGLHVYVPILPIVTYDVIRAGLQKFCEALTRLLPEQVTIALSKAKRDGKVYLDYLQNGYAKTTVAVYSVRPEAGAPVSTPLTWTEVEGGNLTPRQFNLTTVPDRVRKLGDLFGPVATFRQDPTSFLQLTCKLK